jgi:hypothetical protein
VLTNSAVDIAIVNMVYLSRCGRRSDPRIKKTPHDGTSYGARGMVPALSDTHGSFDTFDRKLKVVAPDAEYRESGRAAIWPTLTSR